MRSAIIEMYMYKKIIGIPIHTLYCKGSVLNALFHACTYMCINLGPVQAVYIVMK